MQRCEGRRTGGTGSGSSQPIRQGPGNILTITGSTFSGNPSAGGGGIFNVGTMTVTSSTFNGHTGSFSGGGIYNQSGTLTVTSCTSSGTFGGTSGGRGIANAPGRGGVVYLHNTIVAGNRKP